MLVWACRGGSEDCLRSSSIVMNSNTDDGACSGHIDLLTLISIVRRETWSWTWNIVVHRRRLILAQGTSLIFLTGPKC